MSAVFRVMNWTMCALFLLSVVVQWNDPDPMRWVAIYGAAFAVCLVVARRRRVPPVLPIVIAVVALTWSLVILVRGPAAAEYAHMFDTWKMTNAPIEEAREASGLLIVVAWMTVVAVTERRIGVKR